MTDRRKQRSHRRGVIVEPGVKRNYSASGATDDERKMDQRELEFESESEGLANLGRVNKWRTVLASIMCRV